MEFNELVYHEKQYGSMCGQHCLNNLLQGPYFQPQDLAVIANELDDAERKLVGGELGKSNNVDDSGNFSIQVLKEALMKSYNLNLSQDVSTLESTMERLNNFQDDNIEGKDVGFVCNLREHWFAIRSIRGKLWNLNSMEQRPQKIGLFYLSAYIGQLRAEGYSIFVVDGDIPAPITSLDIGNRSDWFVIGVDDKKPLEEVKTVDQPKDTAFMTEDEQLQAALQASLEGSSSGTKANVSASSPDVISIEESCENAEDEELQRALALSMKDS
mmetsp:Transcript_7851/g.12690  ORF Transcript_7851/g.12690 Transcript_7851/m.12690 type:complete len:270 (+) Transcript_7851:18-827(+)